jgi:hypothetical protein
MATPVAWCHKKLSIIVNLCSKCLYVRDRSRGREKANIYKGLNLISIIYDVKEITKKSVVDFRT